MNRTLIALALGGFVTSAALAAQHDMPAGMTHEQHQALMKKQAEMKKNGNAAMGFDQDKTTHHFFLTGDGGRIQVESNSSTDTASRAQIRAHLKQISREFTGGDFRAPLATHSETPPGVPTMQRLRSKIRYSFAERPQGAEVRIVSNDREALGAIHEFLRYQIKEHATGDPVTVVP